MPRNMRSTDTTIPKSHWIGVGALVVCGFGATLAILTWQHRAQESRPEPSLRTASEQDRGPRLASASGPSERPIQSPSGPPRQTAVETRRSARPVPQSVADVAPEETEPEAPPPDQVPVVMQIQPNADQSYRRTTLRNLSATAITVNLSVSNPSTGSNTAMTVVIPPHRMRNLSELGLTIRPDDHITMQSPGYSDRSLQVN